MDRKEANQPYALGRGGSAWSTNYTSLPAFATLKRLHVDQRMERKI
jgi:hypothetical protein